MWNNAQALDRLANLGFAVAVLMLLYALTRQLAQLDAFAVREVHLVGKVEHVTREQVETVVSNQLRGTFFTVNLAEARAAFEKLPWVRRVDVRRRWPARLEVAVEEHRPVARWGSTALVNEHGEVFEGASNSKLPVFNGPEGTSAEMASHYLEFDRALAKLGRRVDEVRLSPRRAWSLELDDGTVVELGREDVVARLGGFVAAFDRSVAKLEGASLYVDLRYSNGFAVRVKALTWEDRRA